MNTPRQNESEKIPYLPEALGLNPDNEVDLQLYIDSEGDYALGALLLNVRSIQDESLSAGRPVLPEQDAFIASLDKKINERRKELGFPQ